MLIKTLNPLSSISTISVWVRGGCTGAGSSIVFIVTSQSGTKPVHRDNRDLLTRLNYFICSVSLTVTHYTCLCTQSAVQSYQQRLTAAINDKVSELGDRSQTHVSRASMYCICFQSSFND